MSLLTDTATVAAAAVTAVVMLLGSILRVGTTRAPSGRPANPEIRRSVTASLAELPVRLLPERIMRPRRSRPIVPPDAVATWCDSIARAVRSGHTLRSAVEHTEPTHRALVAAVAPVRTVLDRGRPLEIAVEEWRPERRHGPHVELARVVLLVVARLGGPPAAPLHRVASALRARAADGRDRAAQSAQARLSTHVLTAVPIGVLALLVAADADVRHVLSTPIGVTCIGAGLVTNLLGWWWMRRILDGPR